MSRPLTFQEMEEVARKVRRLIKIDSLRCPDLVSVLDNLHSVFKGFTVEHKLPLEMPDDEAFVDFDKKTVYIREDVLQNLMRGDPRARMTVAHEIGHLALGHSHTRRRAIGVDRGAKFAPQIRREESEAKRFAATFLAPGHLARDCDSVEILEEEFQLSRQAAEIRKSELDAYTRQKTGRSRDVPDSVVDFLTEKRKRGHRITSLDDI